MAPSAEARKQRPTLVTAPSTRTGIAPTRYRIGILPRTVSSSDWLNQASWRSTSIGSWLAFYHAQVVAGASGKAIGGSKAATVVRPGAGRRARPNR